MRLKELRLRRGLKQRELAEYLNLTIGAYANYETGKREPGVDTLNKIAEFYNVTVDYVIGNENKQKGKKIPVLGVIPAGVPIDAIEDILEYEEIDSKLAATGTFFALKVKGDSMAPQILQNDIVIIKQQSDFDNNDTCAVIVNGYDATLKRVRKDDTGLWLIPNNSAYQSQFYTAKDVQTLPIKVIGKAIEIRRSI